MHPSLSTNRFVSSTFSQIVHSGESTSAHSRADTASPDGAMPDSLQVQTTRSRGHLFEDQPDVGRWFVDHFVIEWDYVQTAKNLKWWSSVSMAHRAEALELLSLNRLAMARCVETRYAIPRSVDFVAGPRNTQADVENRLLTLAGQHQSLYLDLGPRPRWNDELVSHFDAIGVVLKHPRVAHLVIDISAHSFSTGTALVDAVIRNVADAARVVENEMRGLPALQLTCLRANAHGGEIRKLIDGLAIPEMTNALHALHLGIDNLGQEIPGKPLVGSVRKQAHELVAKLASYLQQTVSLVRFAMDDTPLSGFLLKRIVDGLASNESVEMLRFRNCGLKDVDADLLLTLLARNRRIRSVRLGGNAIRFNHPIWIDPRVGAGS